MSYKQAQYRVYRNGKSKAVLPDGTEAFDYLKESARRHPKAHFIIEKREVIFDSMENADDKAKLSEFRKPRDNSIHASIHASNWNIGREDAD